MVGILKLLILVAVATMFSGCTSTIREKHVDMINSNPGKVHYVTAAPYYRNNTKDSTYRGACLWYRDYRATERKAEYPYSWLNMLGGQSQFDIEGYTISLCEEKYKQACVILLYNNIDRCDATFENSYTRLMQRFNQAQLDIEKKKQDEQNIKTEKIRETCESFGFQKNSNQLSTCVLEMYKSLAQIEAIRASAQMQADAAAANTAELQKLREFEQGMALLKSASNISNSLQPKQPSLNCRYNTIMKTINCN
jgi:hypothetical protein